MDDRLRTLRRAWDASGDRGAWAAWLAEHFRAGHCFDNPEGRCSECGLTVGLCRVLRWKSDTEIPQAFCLDFYGAEGYAIPPGVALGVLKRELTVSPDKPGCLVEAEPGDFVVCDFVLANETPRPYPVMALP